MLSLALMSSPLYVVVPPTPISTPAPHSPGRRPTLDDHSLTLPELTHSSSEGSSVEPERSSSETTIVTIYSMYEEEDASSWSAAAASAVSQAAHSRPKSRNLKDGLGIHIAGSGSIHTMPTYRNSFLEHDPAALEDSAFYDTTTAAYDLRRASMGKRLSVVDKPRISVVSTASSVQLAYASSRPTSARTSASDAGPPGRRSFGSESLRRPSGPRSRPSSSGQHKVSTSNGDSKPHLLPLESHSPDKVPKPLPQTPPLSPLISPPSTPGTPTTPPQRPLHLSSSPSPSPSLRVPAGNHRSPVSSPRSSTSAVSTPESKHAAVLRSEGEDADSFHVRSTYAQLEQCGVKGDGYEEGVERTRARVGGSRASEIRALQALGDEHEKSRELAPQEVQLLQSLDRCAHRPDNSSIVLGADAVVGMVSSRPPRTIASSPCLLCTSAARSRISPRQSPMAPPARLCSHGSQKARCLSRKVCAPLNGAGCLSRLRGTRAATSTFGESSPRRNINSGSGYTRVSPTVGAALLGRSSCADSRGREKRSSGNSWQNTVKLSTSRRRMTYRSTWTYPAQSAETLCSGHGTAMGASSYQVTFPFPADSVRRQRSLFHVLHSLSLKCETCGYCQGMGPLAATLLCYYEPERAYASLVRLHDSYNMHSIFSPGFPGLLEAIYIQERITEQMMPDVYAAFKKHMVSTMSYATKWYITLYANSVPFQTQLRLWDAFLLEGYDVFVAVAVAIVWVYRGGFLFVL